MPASVPPVTDERELLLAYLAHQRYLVRVAAHGLTDEQARLAPSASALSVGGIVKHLAAVERNWMDMVLERPRLPMDQAAQVYMSGFQVGPDETLADVLDDYARAAVETDAVVAGIADLGQAVPVPKGVPWFPQDVDAWSVRWVLLHLVEETARHAGHADIVRESIDGATAIPLLAAAEGWDETPWVRPWKAPVSAGQ
jgi:uncharacterized damage-inducible protein DinB